MFHATSSQLPLQVRRQANNLNTTREHKNFVRCDPPPMRIELSVHDILLTDDEDDFPTPRAFPVPPRSAALASSCYSPRRTSNISVVTSFEEDQASISDASSSDAESIEVPFKVSNSVRKAIKRAKAKQERPSSIVIPSPSAWPRAQNSFCGRERINVAPPTSQPQTVLSPTTLAKLSQSHYPVVGPHSTPSLAGSLSTDDHASFSCPSTPDLRSQADEEEVQWDVPLQLHPEALDTLLHLSTELPQKEFVNPEEISIVMHEPEEMRDRGLSICIPLRQADVSPMEDVVSPISVPSPGGFFASLSGNSSTVWGFGDKTEEPATSEAESFYGVPFRDSRQTLAQTVLTSQCDPDGPPTARRLLRDDGFENDYPESFALDENDIDENYCFKLSEAANSSRSRTDMWIDAQERYMDFLKADTVPETQAEGKTSIATRPNSQPEITAATEQKKTVRFAEVVEAAIKHNARPSEERPRDSVLYHAFQHLSSQAKPRDAYIYRESRAEALRLQRSYMKDSHRARLQGIHCLKTVSQNENKQSCITSKPDSEEVQAQRNAIANASKEQRALQQLSTTSWAMQGMKFLEDGHLLPQSARDSIRDQSAAGAQVRILDFGGLPMASWGWQVAVENRDAKVYTVVPTDKGMQDDWLEHRGPSNHRIVTCPNAWTLPFPAGMFTIISARSLHTMLRTRKVIGHDARDQYAACLAELYRVLAPGGIIHFTTLDAEMSAPANSSLATRSIEFAVSLRTHGYDPCAGRKMADRLEEAGFVDVGRSWMSLPWASADENNNDAITGLVGSLQWESWLLKHHTELGKSEEALLEGIPEALKDASRLANEGKGSAWRLMVGCAKKSV